MRRPGAVTPWLLLLPALALLAAFTHWPALATLWHSAMSTPKKSRPSRFVGLDNYRAMVEDDVFWQALWNNVIFAAGTIPLSIALAIAMALWVNGRIRGRGFLRLAYFTPTVLPMIAVANIWLFFYTPQYGLLEQITGALGLPSHNWLGDQRTALGAITLVARDQLQYSVAELSTHDNQRVTTALNNGLQAALTGSKSPADAMRDSQREATRLLKDFKK